LDIGNITDTHVDLYHVLLGYDSVLSFN